MKSLAAIVALTAVAVGTSSPASRQICRTPELDVPPPGNWPELPTLQQVQAYLVNGDRLQNSDSVCWRDDSNVYNCSLITLETPWDDVSDFHLEIGRLHRLRAQVDGNVLKGNCFLGQLTAYGFFSLVTVGGSLREAYVPGLLSQDLADALNDIYIRSYNEEACIGSAQGVMLGLFPANSGQSFVEVVDVTSVDATMDYLVPNPTICGVLDEIMADLPSNPTFQAHNATVTQPLIAKLATVLGLDPSEVSLDGFKECSISTVCHQTSPTLPPFLANDSLIDLVLEEELWYWNFLTHEVDYVPCAAGVFLSVVSETLPTVNSKGQVVVDKAFSLVSGPVYGPVIFLLTSLGVIQNIPVFADLVLLETYSFPGQGKGNTSTELFVRTIYNSTVVQIPACDGSPYQGLCPMSTFQNILANFTSAPMCQGCAGTQFRRKSNAYGSWMRHFKQR